MLESLPWQVNSIYSLASYARISIIPYAANPQRPSAPYAFALGDSSFSSLVRSSLIFRGIATKT